MPKTSGEIFKERMEAVAEAARKSGTDLSSDKERELHTALIAPLLAAAQRQREEIEEFKERFPNKKRTKKAAKRKRTK